MESLATEQPITSSGTRMPQSPRRPVQQLLPQPNIHSSQSSESAQVCVLTPLPSFVCLENLLDIWMSTLTCFVSLTAHPPAVGGSTQSWRAQQCRKSLFLTVMCTEQNVVYILCFSGSVRYKYRRTEFKIFSNHPATTVHYLH